MKTEKQSVEAKSGVHQADENRKAGCRREKWCSLRG